VSALKKGRYGDAQARYLHGAVAAISKASPLLFFPSRCTDVLVAMLRGESGAPRPAPHAVQHANAVLAASLLMAAYKSVDDWPTVRGGTREHRSSPLLPHAHAPRTAEALSGVPGRPLWRAAVVQR